MSSVVNGSRTMSSREQFIENVIRVVVPDFAQPPRRLRQPVGSFRVSLERSRSAVIEGATSNVGGGLGWLKNGFRKGQWGHRANFSRAWFLWRALMLVWWLGASALAVLVMPQTLQNAARQLGGEPVRAGGIGLLVAVVFAAPRHPVPGPGLGKKTEEFEQIPAPPTPSFRLLFVTFLKKRIFPLASSWPGSYILPPARCGRTVFALQRKLLARLVDSFTVALPASSGFRERPA